MTTTAEEDAAAALRASKAINQMQQALTEESRLLLASILREEMGIAVAEGIAAALPAAIAAVMTDEAAEKFWNKGLEVLQRQATEKTGQFVLGGLRGLLEKAVWGALLLWGAYSLLGWAGVKAALSAIKTP